MSNSLPDILTRWLAHERYTADELADAAECSVKTIYAYAGGNRNIPYKRARRIARYASNTRGDNDIAEDLTGPQFEVSRRGAASADGIIDDEATAMTSVMGAIIDAHKDGDAQRLTDLIENGDGVWERIKAERDRLGSKS